MRRNHYHDSDWVEYLKGGVTLIVLVIWMYVFLLIGHGFGF